jgi:hypothetical protein
MTGGDEAGSELAGPDGPDEQAVLAETLGPALLLLDTLSPSGSLAFVLDDLFAFPFEGNAPVVDRTPGSRPSAGQPGSATYSGRRQADRRL